MSSFFSILKTSFTSLRWPAKVGYVLVLLSLLTPVALPIGGDPYWLGPHTPQLEWTFPLAIFGVMLCFFAGALKNQTAPLSSSQALSGFAFLLLGAISALFSFQGLGAILPLFVFSAAMLSWGSRQLHQLPVAFIQASLLVATLAFILSFFPPALVFSHSALALLSLFGVVYTIRQSEYTPQARWWASAWAFFAVVLGGIGLGLFTLGLIITSARWVRSHRRARLDSTAWLLWIVACLAGFAVAWWFGFLPLPSFAEFTAQRTWLQWLIGVGPGQGFGHLAYGQGVVSLVSSQSFGSLSISTLLLEYGLLGTIALFCVLWFASRKDTIKRWTLFALTLFSASVFTDELTLTLFLLLLGATWFPPLPARRTE